MSWCYLPTGCGIYASATCVALCTGGLQTMGDEVMAAALIDRILHHCHIVNIRGNSYRMRQHTQL